ncbi:uncharacterized protein LOC122242579 isoform X2 [Penaeus japonicus]|uniref:uncharacterized protein LOC122242579 isoform X2 n=1 Tax=Penaeus japonicus TaxID=27405 RepID=UPI001C710685|nr:uncharacterized protein LOC122242579 isoform X2 [Penaeus japonicus]
MRHTLTVVLLLSLLSVCCAWSVRRLPEALQKVQKQSSESSEESDTSESLGSSEEATTTGSPAKRNVYEAAHDLDLRSLKRGFQN